MAVKMKVKCQTQDIFLKQDFTKNRIHYVQNEVIKNDSFNSGLSAAYRKVEFREISILE